MTRAEIGEVRPGTIDTGAFLSRLDKREYWAFVATTFLCFSSTSQLSYLAVIFKNAGIPEQSIGIISSAWSIAAILGPLLSNRLVGHFGAALTAIFGWCIILMSFSALQIAYTDASLATVARFGAGLGFGIFIPAGVLSVNARVMPKHQVYYLGIFSSMMYLPNLFGPAIAEWYIGYFGPGTYFLAMSLPILVAISILASVVRHGHSSTNGLKDGTYMGLLRRPIFLRIGLCVAVTGVLWAFFSVFLTLWMRLANVGVGLFFAPFAIAMLSARFLLLGLISRYSSVSTLCCGLVLMSGACLALAIRMTAPMAVCAAILFALGYSVVFPTAIVGGNESVSPELRSRVASSLNIIFSAGDLVGTVVWGYLIPVFGFQWSAVFGCLLGPTAAFYLFSRTATWRLLVGPNR